MKINEYIKNNLVFLDGAMGTMLQERGLKAGEKPELFNITRPDVITEVHRLYFDAGSNIVFSNTFGANTLHFEEAELENIIKSAIENARKAATLSKGSQEKFVALDIGPLGRLLAPLGDLDFEDAVEIFAKTVRFGAKYGADLVFIETMNDIYETKAALLAAKENCDLPVFVSNAYSENGKLLTGAEPEAVICMLEGMGADAIGVNCSLGPDMLEDIIDKYLSFASVPVIFKPNAGLPKMENGKTVYGLKADNFAEITAKIVKKGVSAVGGCCGTSPEYIKNLVEKLKDVKTPLITEKNITCVSSYTHCIRFGGSPLLIGERINPTGKKRLAAAIKENDISYILGEAIRQKEKGAHILDVNMGLPDIDETKVLTEITEEIQAVTDLPLQIDTGNPDALLSALRRYNGKPLINSVNGKTESMESVFPLQKKYGGVVIALTLDENGIPNSAEERIKIAEKILNKAKEYGISKKDIVFDPLALTVSTDKNAANVTLQTVKTIRERLGCHTSLGVSNVSFGLPERPKINASFLLLALENGLNAAIINPDSREITDAYYSFCALKGLDEACKDYIAYSVNNKSENETKEQTNGKEISVSEAVIKGLKDSAAKATEKALKTAKPLDIVNSEIIPALDKVGKGFEEKTVYLPQLLMSAEAASSAFEIIKNAVISGGKQENPKCDIVLATVKGDIHDIGKNIVKLLLQNYGFKVTDLGKDVEPQKILDTVLEIKAPLVGLSALMTTTLPAMEETVRLISKKAPFCKTVVGGAVLNKDFAEKIGADFYAKDAMETVRYAEKING